MCRSNYTQLAGLKNGVSLAAAEAAGFDIIVTTDQEIPYPQNLASRKIAVVVLCEQTNRLAHLRPLIPAAIEALYSIQPGQVMRIA